MPGYQQANETLQLLRERFMTIYRSIKGSAAPWKRIPGLTNLSTLYEAYLAHCQAAKYKPLTIRSMDVTGGLLKGFSALSGPLSVREYTNKVHARFLNHLTTSLKLHPNSTANTNKHLRAFEAYPFSGHSEVEDRTAICHFLAFCSHLIWRESAQRTVRSKVIVFFTPLLGLLSDIIQG